MSNILPEQDLLKQTYDLVPYPSISVSASHPDRLASIATLFSLQPKDIRHCRVLEIGAASGGNLIPMAYTLPESSFLGLELSAKQVASANQTISKLGIKNIRIIEQDLMSYKSAEGKFDYIICHGVFSWVSASVQAGILKLFAECLAPQGIGYLSYNTYPGWHFRQIVRDMMLFHAKNFDDPANRIVQARALVATLASALKEKNSAYSSMLEQELGIISGQPDGYLFHDHLELFNSAIYFEEFAERLSQQGLRFLGESDLSQMLGQSLPRNLLEVLGELSAGNVLRMEQLLDFATNRVFRQSLICHSDLKPQRRIEPQTLKKLQVASRLKLKPDALSAEEIQLNVNRKIPEPTHPISLAVCKVFEHNWPCWIPFESFVKEVKNALKSSDLPNGDDVLSQKILTDLLEALRLGMLEIHSFPPPFTSQVGGRPLASALARLEAQAGLAVTNLRHENIKLTEASRKLLLLLDGKHSIAELENQMKIFLEPGRSITAALNVLAGAALIQQ